MLKFDGAKQFRHRLLLSTLSGKPIVIKDIRNEDENPGLRGIPLLISLCPFSP